MDVQWTWSLAGRLLMVVGLSCLAAFGAAEFAIALGMSNEAAAIAACGAGVWNFLAVDK